MDAKLVHDYIVAFGLDPRPSESQKTVRLRDKGWSILVETYDWGRVCVATNKVACVVTWVEHGGVPSALPKWAIYARHRFNSPSCVGHHEPEDTTCDGDGTEANAPCVWRGICKAVQTRAESVRTTPERAITYMADDDAGRGPPLATEYASAVSRPIRPPKEAQEHQPAHLAAESEVEAIPRGRVGAPGDPYVFAESRRMALAMMAAFARAIPMEFAGEFEHRCHAGGLFYRDKLRKSRHLTMYVRKNNATATPLAVVYVYPHKRRPGIKLQLVTPTESTAALRAVLPQTLKVIQWKDAGQTPTIIDNITDKHISQVARVLAKHVQDGHWPRLSRELT
jgi:hypothetical protein